MLPPKKEKKKETKQPRITRRMRKVDEMYRKNPTWAEEDDYKFLDTKPETPKEDTNSKKTIMRKGGAMKTKLTKASKGVIVKLNGNQLVQKVAGSSGVKSGVNSKAKEQKVAKGRSGGNNTSAKVLPKGKYGMSMRKK